MRSRRTLAVLILGWRVMFADATTGMAATWDGGGNGIWDALDEPADWDGTVPSTTVGADINDGSTVPVDGARDTQYLRIGNGSALEIGVGDSVTTTHDVLLATHLTGGGPNGTITQTDGLFTVAAVNGHIIGHTRAGGVHTLSGGTLHALGNLTLGWADGGHGVLTVSGGTLDIDGSIVLGRSAGTSGNMSISGSAIVDIALDARWGLAAPGVLTITGGDATITVGNNMTFDLATSELHASIDATGFSMINVTGSVGYNGTLTVTATGPMTHGQQWKLIDANGLLGGAFGSEFVNAPEGSTVFDNGTTALTIHYGADGDVVLVASHPSTWHWWKMDEPSGATVGDFGSPGGMDGTILGVGSTRVTPAFSRVGNALDTSSGWGYVDAGNVPITGSFSANIWVDPNDVGSDWRPFISKWAGGTTKAFWVGQHSTAGFVRFGLSFNGTAETALDTPAAAVGNNCWQMITVVWDETTKEQKLYVNGVLKASAVRAGQSLATPRDAHLQMMAFGDNVNQLLGTTDDVRLYGRALSDDDIRALYASPGVEVPEVQIMAKDKFDGPSLETGWTLDDREVADTHDLTARPGWLRVGISAAENTWLNNRDGAAMLYTDAPNGSFTMETRVDIATGNGGTPVAYSSGGLVVHDPSYVTAQYPFAMYYWLGHDGTTTALSLQKPGGNLATALTGVSSHMYLRLYRNADNGTWVASYKVNQPDAWTEWVTITDGVLPNADVSDTDIYVGIMTKTWSTNPANIDYDYFNIPEVSSPNGSLFLIQ